MAIEDDYFENLISDVPKAHEPVYEMTGPNHQIELWKGLAEVTEDIGKHDQTVTIFFEWLPTPALKFKFSHQLDPSKIASVVSGAHEISFQVQSEPELKFSGFTQTAPWKDGVRSVDGYIQ